MIEAPNLIGKEYGKWIVLSRVADRLVGNGSIGRVRWIDYWLCKCACNTTYEVCGRNLRANKTHGCPRCSRVGIFKRSDEWTAHRSFYAKYKSLAENRKIPFLLSKKQFIRIVKQDCYYCKESPTIRNCYSTGRIVRWKFNGVDRLDNDRAIGYTKSNSVPCCSICNLMKRKLTEQQFIAHIKKIYNAQSNKGES